MRKIRKRKILFIEDDLTAIEVYEDALKKAGFDIESLQWGRDGLARLEEIKEGKKEKPDLILLDLILPDINGLEILKKAKEDKDLKEIPFIVLTNYGDPKLEQECRKVGIEEHIDKTEATPSQLAETIKNWFKNR